MNHVLNRDFQGCPPRVGAAVYLRRKRFRLGLPALVLGSCLIGAVAHWRNPAAAYNAPGLQAETAIHSAARLSSHWQQLLPVMNVAIADQGLARWLKGHPARSSALDPLALDDFLGREHKLSGLLQSGAVRSTFPILGLEVHYRQRPVFTHHQGLGRASARPIASVSKTFTSAAVMLLVQEHKIALDDDIALYFPEARHLQRPLSGHPVTIRHLLSHTSGISYRPAFGSAYTSPYRKHTVYPIAKQMQPVAASFHYSNFNYYILAALIEKVSHQGYDQFMAERIFAPLQLVNTSVNPAARGAAGISSSLADMAVFTGALFDPGSVSGWQLAPRYVQEMIQCPPGHVLQDEDEYYGLGIRVRRHKGHIESLFHSGLWQGVFAELRFFYQSEVVLVHQGVPTAFRSPGVGGYRWQSVVNAQAYADSLQTVFASPEFKPGEHLAIQSSAVNQMH
ncbi:MAG: beta-lactamase family protein [Leptospiraceae bacterium]|nr:beta-lactamase family protein [Leptospiraceae bacterium]